MNSTTPHEHPWRWPGLRVIGPLDLLLAIIILLLLNALALRLFIPLTARARFGEVLVAAGDMRNQVVESFALSGEPIDMPGGTSEITVQRTASQQLSGPQTSVVEQIRDAKKQIAELPGETQRATGTHYIQSLRIQGSAIVIAGQLSGLAEGDFDFALTPAATDNLGRVPQVLVWQCGRNLLPDGWTGPTVLLQRPAPDFWLPERCRSGKAAS